MRRVGGNFAGRAELGRVADDEATIAGACREATIANEQSWRELGKKM